MTTPSISSHASDAELNAAVAEHVGGWSSLHLVSEFRGVHFNGKVLIGVRLRPPMSLHELVPAYSTSIDAIWLLLAKCPTVRIYHGVDTHVSISSTPGYIVGEGIAPRGQLAHAACFALLRSAGVEVVDS